MPRRALCVAEKPSIAKEVARLLSGGRMSSRPGKNKYCRNFDFDYTLFGEPCQITMTSVMGHLMSSDFTEAYKKWAAIPPIKCFEAPIIKYVSQDMRDVAQNLEIEGARADVLIIWTDCDREGENIGNEIVQTCKRRNKHLRVLRAKFSVIQYREVKQAMDNPVQLDLRQSEAVEARIELDLRIGAAFTRFQTLTFSSCFSSLDKKVISYGSCQFPTLGFVVDQFLKAERFVPEDFWKLDVTLVRQGDHGHPPTTTKFAWARDRLFDKAFCVIIYEAVMMDPTATVTRVIEKETQKWKPLPLTTVELQKCGARLLRISSDKMMEIAERLYQKGFISYPRTETDQFEKGFALNPLIEAQCQNPVWGQYAQSLLDGKFQFPRNGKNNDKAHPPIHPVKDAPDLAGDDKRVYEFVVRRFLACCSSNARGHETTVEIDINGEQFSARGLAVSERNYLDIYTYDKWADANLPHFTQGETFLPTAVEMHQGTTTAPALLTEADLITLMDKNGIGTDATIQDHIKKILEREYAYKDGRGGGGGGGRGRGRNGRGENGGGGGVQEFSPSTLGMGLVKGYDRLSLEYSLSKPYLRAKMEADMRRICEGAMTREQVVQAAVEMYRQVFKKAFKHRRRIIRMLAKYLGAEPDAMPTAPTYTPEAPFVRPCRKCGQAMRFRKSQTQKLYIGCEGYPACRESIWFPASIEEARVSNRTCDKCSRPQSPVHLMGLRFAQGSSPPMLPNPYEGCVSCDENLMELFDNRSLLPNRGGTGNAYSGSGEGRGEFGNGATRAHGGGGVQAPAFHSSSSSAATIGGYNGNENRYRGGGDRGGYGSGNGNFLGDAPQCQCGRPASPFTVRKEGPTQGKRFFKCSDRDNGCKFFQWEDEYIASKNSGSTNVDEGFVALPPAEMQQYRAMALAMGGGSRSDGNGVGGGSGGIAGRKPQCNCGLTAKLLTARKEGPNQGREFYGCPNLAGNARCGFFAWREDVENGGEGGSGGSFGRFGGGSGSDGGGRYGGDGPDSDSVCYRCNEPGHFASSCPNGDMRSGGGQSGRGSGRGRGRGRGRGSSTRRR